MPATLVVNAFLAAMAAPQQATSIGEEHALRSEVLVEAAATAIAVVLPHRMLPSADDELALAMALARFRHQRGQAVLPVGAESTFEVLDGRSVFGVLLPRGTGAAAAVAWFETLLAPPTAAEGDALELAAARAALAADDADWLYPGEILLGRSRAALVADPAFSRTARGAAGFLLSSPTARLAEHLAAGPGGALRVVVLGDAAVAQQVGDRLRRYPVGAAVPPMRPVRALAAGTVTPHPRIGGPFAAAAVLAPRPAVDSLPFAAAVEVLRARAAQRFGTFRGDESRARAPFVEYSFLRGDPIVACFRRGRDGQPVERPMAELEALLADARRRPPTASEVEGAVHLLQAEWSVPPWSQAQHAAFQRRGLGLLPAARALALLGCHGIPDTAVRELSRIGTAVVAEWLGTALHPDAVRWSGLTPGERPPVR